MASQSTTTVLTSSSSSSSAPQPPPSPRFVRFQEQCALIPELSVLVAAKSPPRMVTKSLSLPVLNLQLPWKRPSVAFHKQPPIPERHQPHAYAEQGSQPDHLVIRVPVPVFRRKSLSPVDARNRALPPCLVNRGYERKDAPFSSPNATQSSASRGSASKPRGRPVRSTSLPSTPFSFETIPLRPCCTNCFAACTSLPPLVESSQEHNHPGLSDSADDWCMGVHFTKGAMRRHRSVSAEGQGFHANVLRVDEADCRHPVPKSNSCNNPKIVHLKVQKITAHTPDIRSFDSAQDDDDSELFPLPSPKRTPTGSPSPSPSASAQNLPGIFSHGPGKLETTIREKIAQRAREKEVDSFYSDADKYMGTATRHAQSLVTSRSESLQTKESLSAVSHFKSHSDEIEYDESLPDPDALPPGSTILLNSPPSSPPLPPSPPDASTTVTSLSLLSPPPSSPGMYDRSKKRRPSLSAGVVGIVHAGVGVLRGISLSTNNSIAA